VEGVTVHHLNSFPSGHTLTAFSAAFLIRILFPCRPLWHALAFLLAILCGLSRVVLVQHWPADVLGGMVLGLLASFLVSGRAGWPPVVISRLFSQKKSTD
jgi:membrane-associated phospholipid phosphatase